MNEKEIIENCNVIFDNLEDMMSEESAEDYRESYRQFKDLYTKEKVKYKELLEGLKYRVNYCKLLEKELYKDTDIELTKIEQKYIQQLLEEK